jgi:phosphoglycerate dehydrogenase-like enzyme
MRIHVQNPTDDPDFAITAEQWARAAVRAGEPPHAISFGTTHADFAPVAGGAELLIGTPATLRALGRLVAPRLRLVFVNAAGVDGLAPFDWLPDSVALLNNRGTHGAKAGEYIAMAALMLAARMPALAAAQRAACWRPMFAPPLAGRRVTIVGTGDLGSAGARALRGLGVAVTGVRSRAAPHPDFAAVAAVAALDEVLPRSDLVVLACPLTPATVGLLDRRRLSLLPPGAGVVNLGRGGLLDQDALCDRLDAGQLSGAVLDVVDPEPLPPGHRLWRTANLVITPHVSCDDPGSYNELSLAILFANLRAWRAGAALPNRIDLARGY